MKYKRVWFMWNQLVDIGSVCHIIHDDRNLDEFSIYI